MNQLFQKNNFGMFKKFLKAKLEDVKMAKFIYLQTNLYVQTVVKNYINAEMIEIIYTFPVKAQKNFMEIVLLILLGMII